MKETRAGPEPIQYDTEVDPEESRQFRYEVGENYLGNPVEVPIIRSVTSAVSTEKHWPRSNGKSP